ncbi:MAG: hypothetical protein WEB52_04650 [Dehalococcoidia bacterium]
MADERERDVERTSDLHRREKEDIERDGPSPYDEASPHMPADRVITKGQPEKPGPAGAELDAVDEHVPSDDDLLQTGQIDRGGEVVSGGTGGMSGSLEDEEALEANDESGTLGGEGLHRRLQQQATEEDMLGDEEDG